MENKKWYLTVQENGLIIIPPDLWQRLRQASGIKSKKRRIIKKAVKRVIVQAILEMVDKHK